MQTEKLTPSLEKVRCQLTSETEGIDSSDEVHVVNNVTVPFANSCPGIFTDGLAQFFAFRGQTRRYLWVAWLDGRVSDWGEVGTGVPATWPNVLAATTTTTTKPIIPSISSDFASIFRGFGRNCLSAQYPGNKEEQINPRVLASQLLIYHILHHTQGAPWPFHQSSDHFQATCLSLIIPNFILNRWLLYKKIISEQLRFLPLIWFCSIPWTL